MSDEQRLQAAKSKMEQAVSTRLAEVMGLLQASRDLLAQLEDCDRELQRQGDLQAEAAGRGRGADAEAAGDQIVVLRSVRAHLLDSLDTLADQAS